MEFSGLSIVTGNDSQEKDCALSPYSYPSIADLVDASMKNRTNLYVRTFTNVIVVTLSNNLFPLFK